MREIPEKNVYVNGKIIGANTTIKLSVKTAIWIISILFTFMMGILTYSYFDLRKYVNIQYQEFSKSIENKVNKIQEDVNTIRIGQEAIKGDIKVILDRQTRSTPQYTRPVNPPTLDNVNGEEE